MKFKFHEGDTVQIINPVLYSYGRIGVVGVVDKQDDTYPYYVQFYEAEDPAVLIDSEWMTEVSLRLAACTIGVEDLI